MRRAVYFVLNFLLLAALPCPLSAQTYNPKSIRFVSTDPAQRLDTAELLRISNLQQGVPLSKDDIDAALQKLGDSGAFADLSYTVNDTALTIKLTPAVVQNQALPVRFVNFVWWSHDELIKLLEQRVPLFHGNLPLQSNQTGEVEEALVALLVDKGIPDARVTALPSSDSPGDAMNAVALAISSPQILVGEVRFDGAVPAVTEKLTTLTHALADRNFDLREMNATLHDSAIAIFEDAGYLEAKNDPIVFATPRKDLGGYVVDIQVPMQPGPLYHIGSITLHAQSPVSDASLRAVLPFKTGDPASAASVRDAVAVLAHLYGDYGFLQARASASLDKVPSNHTVNYSFNFSPGPQYHLASIDVSELPTELQQEFSTLWHTAPGVVIDKDFQTNLRETLEKLHTRMGIFVAVKRDNDAHSAVIILQLRKLPGVSTEPADSGAPLPSSVPPPPPPMPTQLPPMPGRRRPR
jgi:outer membrane protein assembly factor BamA